VQYSLDSRKEMNCDDSVLHSGRGQRVECVQFSPSFNTKERNLHCN
jgi:hypothetical protein